MTNSIEKFDNKGWNPSEIAALDLSRLRNSDLQRSSYFLLLLPVIGWIALAYLKLNYVTKHRAAENILKQSKFSLLDSNQKIAAISEAILVSGPLAWQYQLEAARLHLLSHHYMEATQLLAAVRERRKITLNPIYENKILNIHHCNGYEALLTAAILAANEQYEHAYDAYEEVRYYNHCLSNTLLHQHDLVQKMRENRATLGSRGKEIINHC